MNFLGIAWYKNVYGQGLQKIAAMGAESVSIKLQLFNAQTNALLQQLEEASLAFAEQESRVRGAVSKQVFGYQGKKVIIKLVAAGLAEETSAVIPGVAEVFLMNKKGAGKQQPQLPEEKVTSTPADFVLLPSYPNPFSAGGGSAYGHWRQPNENELQNE